MSRHVTHHGHTPDLLNDLHTLRSLANAVKEQADTQRLWQISAIVATISEEATICIEKFEGTHGTPALGTNDQPDNETFRDDAQP